MATPPHRRERSRSVSHINIDLEALNNGRRPSSLPLSPMTPPSARARYARRGSVADVWKSTMGAIMEKEKLELKSRITELEDYQSKYEHEQRENQILQNRLQDLMAGQSDATKSLMRTSETLDRLRLDHKKKVEQIEKMQRDLGFKDDRIRNLEIRASEVEKAELILETTKQNLESCQNQVKVRDAEIKRLHQEVDDLNRQIDAGNKRIEEMEEKMEDMKVQVRHEIMKNENIEKNLETIPRLKDTIKECEDEIGNLKKHINDKNALLAAARKTVREYKDTIRQTEHDVSQTQLLKDDLAVSQYEVQSLKHLMCGKDYLVTQRTKALDLSKEIISVLNDTLDDEQVQRIQHILDRLSGTEIPSLAGSRSIGVSTPDGDFRSVSAPPGQYRSSTPGHRSAHHRDINVNHQPYGYDADGNQVVVNGNMQNGNSHHRFMHSVIVENDGTDKRKRPVSAAPTSGRKTPVTVHKTSSFREAHKVYTKPLPRKSFDYDRLESPRYNHVSNKTDPSNKHQSSSSPKIKPTMDYNLIGMDDSVSSSERSGTTVNSTNARQNGHIRLHSTTTTTEVESISSSDSDCEDELTADSEATLRSMNARDRDVLMAEVVNVGDRVLISCPQKPPKYGKKRVLKPINYTGIVKFVGKLNPDKYDARIHAGIRMDEQVGDTDGTYKGRRLMYTPGDQGKFYKLRDLTSVLNVKTGRYVPMKRLIGCHLHRKVKEHQRDAH
ncbi:uncharacterized protein LOC128242367 isoform X3 [Mya arenaria]|uniref:uncharacterized protein LOC128242367 isoform X3 n=1 Tax=Mya arenaria TaxID=6604 RepID=UPI0022E5EF14|nr:uncharacterized protein LOC128242367 isoform X3 [Mya arenaria]